jgi:hypothetical protein
VREQTYAKSFKFDICNTLSTAQKQRYLKTTSQSLKISGVTNERSPGDHTSLNNAKRIYLFAITVKDPGACALIWLPNDMLIVPVETLPSYTLLLFKVMLVIVSVLFPA